MGNMTVMDVKTLCDSAAWAWGPGPCPCENDNEPSYSLPRQALYT
jgi:hypothetical protein